MAGKRVTSNILRSNNIAFGEVVVLSASDGVLSVCVIAKVVGFSVSWVHIGQVKGTVACGVAEHLKHAHVGNAFVQGVASRSSVDAISVGVAVVANESGQTGDFVIS